MLRARGRRVGFLLCNLPGPGVLHELGLLCWDNFPDHDSGQHFWDMAPAGLYCGQFMWLSIAMWYPPAFLLPFCVPVTIQESRVETARRESLAWVDRPCCSKPSSQESLEVSFCWKVLHLIVGPDGGCFLFSSFQCFFNL